jgi:hypothetical protein
MILYLKIKQLRLAICCLHTKNGNFKFVRVISTANGSTNYCSNLSPESTPKPIHHPEAKSGVNSISGTHNKQLLLNTI